MVTKGELKAGFHMGNAIMRLADGYGRPSQVITELVQNAIDSGADDIEIMVKTRQRLMYCADSGAGESLEGISKRIRHIAEEQKAEGLGHKGVGFLAGLAISEGFSFVTKLKNDPKARYFCLDMSREGLDGMKESVSFPYRNENRSFTPAKVYHLKTSFAVSTLVIFKNVSQSALRQLKNVQTAATAIESHFSAQIRERGIRVWLDIDGVRHRVKPIDFLGEQKKVIIKTPKGPVTFDIYALPKPIKDPKVFVVHEQKGRESYSIPFKPFLEVDPKIREVFNSGYIQGNIHLPFCTLSTDREEFVYDEDLQVFWEAIEEYCMKHGLSLVESRSDQKKEVKINRVIINVIGKLKWFIKEHSDELKTFFKAQVSEGHFAFAKGKQGETIRSKPPKERQEEGGCGSGTPQFTRPKVHHGGVVTPSGSRRRIVSETGLAIEYRSPHPEENHGWRCKREETVGTIVFNCLHPDWQAAEAKVEMLEHYILHLVLKELALVNVPEAQREGFNDFFENLYIGPLVKVINQGFKK